MKNIFAAFAIVFGISSQILAVPVEKSSFYIVPVETSTYPLGATKAVTIAMKLAFLDKRDAELATQKTDQIKASLQATLEETTTDFKTKEGKVLLGAELSSRLQNEGIKAQSVFWNTFVM